MASTSPLFSPLAIRGLTLPNRIMVSPMAQYSAVEGMANDWHFANLAKFAMGGAGLVFVEATRVEQRGSGSIGDLGLWKDEHIAPLRRITEFLRAHGSASGIQLNHAGRKSGTLKPWEGWGPLPPERRGEGGVQWDVIAPSAVEYLPDWPIPREMSLEDIRAVQQAFVDAARRALEAGFDVVEIHAAHGYLLHQFLSPASNRRTDAYGGTLEKRMRFVLEIAERIRALWPADKPVFLRVSAVDEGGWTLDDTVTLARELKRIGIDAIDCSASGISIRSPTATRIVPELGFQVPYAERVRRDADIRTIAVGLIVHARQAEAIIAEGKADLVALGRELLYNPFWPVHAARELGVDPEFRTMPPQYGWWLDRRVKTGYRG